MTDTLADRLWQVAEEQQWRIASQLAGRRVRLVMRRPPWLVSLEFTPNGQRIRSAEVFRDGSRVDLTSSAPRIRRYLKGQRVPPSRTLL